MSSDRTPSQKSVHWRLRAAVRTVLTLCGSLAVDVQATTRLLLRRPGVPIACIVTLSLGMGAATTVFNWCNGILLNPYPAIPDSGGLIVLAGRNSTGALDTLPFSDFDAYRQHARSLRDVVGSAAAVQRLVLTRESENTPDAVIAHAVSGNYFDALGVPMAHGRGFSNDEDRTPGTHPVAVISHGLWMRRFGGSPNVVGQNVQFNSIAFTVVGVAGPGFPGTLLGLSIDVWTPLMMQERLSGVSLQARHERWVIGLGRLRDGVDGAAAQGQLDTIAKDLNAALPIDDARQPTLIPVWRSPWGAQGGIGPVLGVLAVVALLVLVLAAMNVANLLLARAVERRREFAIRLGLGASRKRLLFQLLTEGTAVAFASALASMVIARFSAGLLTSFLPPTDNPLTLDVALDNRVILFAAALTIPTTLLASLTPALQAIRPQIVHYLREEGSGVTSRAGTLVRRILLGAQVGLACMFLVITALLIRSVQNAGNIDAGFSQENVVLARYDTGQLPDARSGSLAHQQLIERLRTLPQVRGAGVTTRVPLGFTPLPSARVSTPGYVAQPDEDTTIGFSVVSDGYFDTMRVRWLAGRDFLTSDDERAPRVAIVNEAMAERFWSGGPPLGQAFRLGEETAVVIGVVSTIKQRMINEDPLPHVYLPLWQHPRTSLILHVRAESVSAAVSAIRDAMRSEFSELPPVNVTTLSSHLGFATLAQRVTGTFLGASGLLATILAAVGIFGLVAYDVARRTREFGLRLALGASRPHIVALAMRDVVVPTVAGLAVGMTLALLAGRALRSLLIGTSPAAPGALAAAVLVLVVVALAAALGPAVRACRSDPASALRDV